MIKLLYLLLLIPSIALGGAATIGGVAVGDIDTLGGVAIEDIDTFGGVTVGSPFACDCSGVVTFCWTMEDDDSTPDVTIGTPTGCSDNDTVGATTGAVEYASTVGQPDVGTLAFHIDSIDDRVTFGVSSEDIADLNDFTITFALWVVSFPTTGDFDVLGIRTADTNSRMRLMLAPSGGMEGNVYDNNGGAHHDIAISGLSTGEWLSCEYSYKQGVGSNDTYLACGATSNEADEDPTVGNATTQLIFGDRSGDEAEVYYLDNVTVQPCTRY